MLCKTLGLSGALQTDKDDPHSILPWVTPKVSCRIEFFVPGVGGLWAVSVQSKPLN